ncbi:MAG: TonB family protein [Terriglobales bacterium]
MRAATSLALEKVPRAFPRYSVKVPLDVIALRSGIPENLPGRCADLSEGGVGAMVAGELSAGQQVALELRLPNLGLPVRARAVVCYQGAIRCGFEFVGLATDQREMIRYWLHRLETESAKVERPKAEPEPAAIETRAGAVPQKAPKIRVRLRRFNLLLAAMLLLALAGWWQWQRSWHELEKGSAAQTTPLRVSPEIMTARIVSKTAPVYPEEARRSGTQGLVVLDVLIAADGTVRRLQPISGDGVLAKSATDAVRQWKFEPYGLFGRAREVETSIAVDFRLN